MTRWLVPWCFAVPRKVSKCPAGLASALSR
ncbi:hypothetical protein [Vibrio phage vB_VpaP_M9]|nr:hypothetical protein [Vibrio phage vB_VpaP_M9]